jgi:esterase/lipase
MKNIATQVQAKNKSNYLKGLALASAGLGSIAGGWWLFLPVSLEDLKPRIRPAKTYAEAIAKFEQLQSFDGKSVNPVCRSNLLTHGHQTEKAIILFHGLSNCPRQFQELGEQFFNAGYNVLIPRMPTNGYKNRRTPQFKQITAEKLCRYGDISTDIATGLGKEVRVIGLSGGGVVAAWVAQNRPELNKVVLVAPAFSVTTLPSSIYRPLVKIFTRLPNVWLPRNPLKVLPHAYLQQSTRSTGQMMRLGLAVFEAAKQKKPAAKAIVMVTNLHDVAVDNNVAKRLVQTWQAGGAKNISEYTFDRSLKLLHDLISTQQSQQKTAQVYPILFELADA